jgi:DNA transformation protein and related proteins
MAADSGLIAWLEEAMAPLGQVTWRRMFGGVALYCDGRVFAIAGDDTLWFKADAKTAPAWDAAGAAPFSFEKKDGTVAVNSYRRAPDDCYDDAESLRDWARLALEASARAPARKRKGAR